MKAITKFIVGFIGFIAGTLILTALLYSLDPFGIVPHPPRTSTTATGWAKLTPLWSSLYYESRIQMFHAQFNNLNGMPIEVTEAHAVETLTGTICEVTVDGVEAREGILTTPVRTGAGDTFQLNASCSAANKNAQDRYAMEITIIYDTVLGSIYEERTEKGTVQGPAE